MTDANADLISALASSDVAVRIDAIANLARQPDVARSLLAVSLTASGTSTLAKVWAMIALCHIRDDEAHAASTAVVQCLQDPDAVVRRSAIETLGALGASWTVTAIAAKLVDHASVPDAWFDDNSSPSQAAQRVLQSFGSPEALAALALAST